MTDVCVWVWVWVCVCVSVSVSVCVQILNVFKHLHYLIEEPFNLGRSLLILPEKWNWSHIYNGTIQLTLSCHILCCATYMEPIPFNFLRSWPQHCVHYTDEGVLHPHNHNNNNSNQKPQNTVLYLKWLLLRCVFLMPQKQCEIKFSHIEYSIDQKK